ncbi:MAG: SDR family oxidoreductase [Thermodesulfobacteriota bacterium]
MAVFMVTGGAGFIGSHIVDRLVEEGHRVKVVDNFSTGRRENLAHLEGHPSVQMAEGDVCDWEFLIQAMEGVDYVLHQAAIPSVPRSVSDPVSSHRVNVEGTLKVLMASREAGVSRVVLASSSSVYGDVEGGSVAALSKKESLPPRPLSPYAATKLAAEGYCLAFYHSYGLETVILRYFNVFGPRQDPTSQYASVVPRFASALIGGKQPVIYGDGLQTRDFTYVSNIVDANLMACQALGAAGGVFNVACGRSISVLQLLDSMARALGTKAEPRFEPPRPGDVRHSRANISLARKILGYRVGVDFQRGIAMTLDAMRGRA